MHIRFCTFFLQSFYHVSMRRKIRTANTKINNILSLFIETFYLPQFLRKIVFSNSIKSFCELHDLSI